MRHALDNVRDLIAEIRGMTANKQFPNTEGNRKALDLLNESLANLEGKFAAGSIKSVQGLDDDALNKYRHGTERGSPKAAYCDDITYIKNGSGEDRCARGDIIVDAGILDPGAGTPIDPSTQDGWQKKWTLAHILVHEKFHEIMLNAQINISKSRPGWGAKTPAQQEQELQRAEQRAASAESHAEVYTWQKNLLRILQKALEQDLKDLKKNAAANQDAIADVNAKIGWIKKELTRLEEAKRQAVHGHDFGFDGCGWPDGFANGVAALYVTYPGGYWVLGATVAVGQSTDMVIAEEAFFDAVEPETPMPAPPSLYVLLTESVFSGMQIQEDPCGYIDWATSAGQIRVVADPNTLRAELPQPLRIVVTDGVGGQPLTDAIVEILDPSGTVIHRTRTDEAGTVATFLPPGAYTVRLVSRIIGLDVSMHVQDAVDVSSVAELRITVSAIIIPFGWVPAFVHGLIALVAGILGIWAAGRWRERLRLPRWGPYAVGAAAAAAVFFPLGLL